MHNVDGKMISNALARIWKVWCGVVKVLFLHLYTCLQGLRSITTPRWDYAISSMSVENEFPDAVSSELFFLRFRVTDFAYNARTVT